MHKQILFILSTLALLMYPLSLSAQNNFSISLAVNSAASNQSVTPDFDGNGIVDFADFLAFTSLFGSRQGDGRYDARYDLDSDGAIGFSDFIVFVGTFGRKNEKDLMTLNFFQGPLISTVSFDSLLRGWSSTVSGFVNKMMRNRETVMALKIPLSAQLSEGDIDIVVKNSSGQVLGGVTKINRIDTVTSDSTKEFIYSIPREYITDKNSLKIVMDGDNRIQNDMFEGRNIINFSLSDLNFTKTPLAPMKIKFIFAHVPLLDPEKPAKSDELIPLYMESATKYLPIASNYIVMESEEVTFNLENNKGSLYSNILLEIEKMRIERGDQDVYYHAVVNKNEEVGGLTVGGMAYRGGFSSIGLIGSIHAFIHELGHNLNLGHAPGCGATGVDSSFPYHGRLVGEFGWIQVKDVDWVYYSNGEKFFNIMYDRYLLDGEYEDDQLKEVDWIYMDGNRYYDMMSYCDPNFISQYSYRAALDYRISKNEMILSNRRASKLTSQNFERKLLFSGRIDSQGKWSFYSLTRFERAASKNSDTHQDYTLSLIDRISGEEVGNTSLKVLTIKHAEKHWFATISDPTQNNNLIMIIKNKNGQKVLEKDLMKL